MSTTNWPKATGKTKKGIFNGPTVKVAPAEKELASKYGAVPAKTK